MINRVHLKTETVQGETHVFGYSYDAQGRLTDVTRDGTATSHYEFDANGNRTVAPGLTASPVYDNQDRLLSYGSCTYAYKADGSLQTKTCPEGTTSYEYDALGNLRHVTLPNGTNIDYVIDGQNRRIGKRVNGVLVERFLYRSQLQPVAWLNGDGSVRATFVYGGKPNVPEYMVQGGATYRLITDQVGSVRLAVNGSTGMVAERIEWDEFGNVVADSAVGFLPFGFAGGLRDLDAGLVRFGARDYGPLTGRWTAKDPLRFGAGVPNLYSYVDGEPINFIDPRGLDKWKVVFRLARGGLIAIRDVTREQAARFVRLGEDVWTKRAADAANLAEEIGEGKACRHPPHKSGYSPHFHPSDESGRVMDKIDGTKPGHMFYGDGLKNFLFEVLDANGDGQLDDRDVFDWAWPLPTTPPWERNDGA
jgi:RHS repeat-associated protein